MDEENAKGRRSGAPKNNPPPKSPPQKSLRRDFINPEQRKLYIVMTAFNIAKALAILMVFLLVLGMI